MLDLDFLCLGAFGLQSYSKEAGNLANLILKIKDTSNWTNVAKNERQTEREMGVGGGEGEKRSHQDSTVYCEGFLWDHPQCYKVGQGWWKEAHAFLHFDFHKLYRFCRHNGSLPSDFTHTWWLSTYTAGSFYACCQGIKVMNRPTKPWTLAYKIANSLATYHTGALVARMLCL